MSQIPQLVAAAPLVGAYVLSLLGYVDAKAVLYIIANLIGSTVLAIGAITMAQWATLLVEGTWATASLVMLIYAIHARRTTANHPQGADPDERSTQDSSAEGLCQPSRRRLGPVGGRYLVEHDELFGFGGEAVTITPPVIGESGRGTW